jgi:F0F1-type ATP synthase assembly protein I
MPDDRPPIVRGMEWVARATTIALEMALPPLAGSWADDHFGTEPLLTVVGAVLGLITGIWHLVRLTKPMPDEDHDRQPPEGRSRP